MNLVSKILDQIHVNNKYEIYYATFEFCQIKSPWRKKYVGEDFIINSLYGT